MVFSSAVFVYAFLPVVLFCYYVLFRKHRKAQNTFLLLASLLFYAWGEPKAVLVMIASILINWFFGWMIGKNRENRKKNKLLLTADVMLNLAVLFVFKYLVSTCSSLNQWFGLAVPVPAITLPIGISFFTFQGMSYVIDVYRRKGEVQPSILSVGLYIAFFPQLVAGPIVRYETIADQIMNRKETPNDLFDGFARFVVGLSKKVLLANGFAVIADAAFEAVGSGEHISVLFAWLGAAAYMLQIFFDFGGYSDMAIGLGRMFGFHYLENFDYPYISTSVTEFWRRWHISLGAWFRDYVYYPLGGSRCGRGRTILNLFIVWALTGIWHGADLTFLLWGLLYFVLLVFEKQTGLHKITGKKSAAFRWLYTMWFVLLGWVLFRGDSVGEAVQYYGLMFGLPGNDLIDAAVQGWLIQNMILFGVGLVLCTPLFRTLARKTENSRPAGIVKAGGLICLFILSVASFVCDSYNPFIYFQF